MVQYTAFFNVDGGLSHGFGVKESSNYEKEEKFKFPEDLDLSPSELYEQICIYAAILGKKISIDALSNPETELTKVTLLKLVGPEGEIDQKKFVSKYDAIRTKKRSISFKVEDGKIVLVDHSFEKVLRLAKE